jgi:AraC-like DNA-binding protein
MKQIKDKLWQRDDTFFCDEYFAIQNNNAVVADLLIGTPYRIGYTAFFIVTQGEADFTIGLMQQHLQAGSLLVMNEGAIYEPEHCSADFCFHTLVMSDDFIARAFVESKPKALEKATYGLRELSDDDMDVLCTMFETLIRVSDGRMSDLKVADHLISAVVFFSNDRMDSQTDVGDTSVSRDQTIFNKFISLLKKHASRERSLDFYAQKLFITRNYLSIVVSRYSDVTVKEWIERAVIMEAKVRLRHSNMSVIDIADDLNFASDSFFCKYFKRITGQTPMTYRGK